MLLVSVKWFIPGIGVFLQVLRRFTRHCVFSLYPVVRAAWLAALGWIVVGYRRDPAVYWSQPVVELYPLLE